MRRDHDCGTRSTQRIQPYASYVAKKPGFRDGSQAFLRVSERLAAQGQQVTQLQREGIVERLRLVVGVL